jgi:hypothetical protein
MRVLLATVVLVACGPSNRDNPGTDAPSQDDASDTDAPPADTSRVFAHSNATLYQLNNATLATTTVGSMTGLGTAGLLDLAIDRDDRMLGVTRDSLWEIDPDNGEVTLIADLETTNPTSLSFIPEDLDDPNSREILITVDDGDVMEIDTVTGQSTVIGNLGDQAGQPIRSSGDLFAVSGLGIYATVNIGPDDDSVDFLARIDPVTWKATPIGVGTGFNKIFGLGFWGGKIYGFVDLGFEVNSGKMIDIDINTGVGTELSESSQRWFGAGVATDAPILL